MRKGKGDKKKIMKKNDEKKTEEEEETEGITKGRILKKGVLGEKKGKKTARTMAFPGI